MENREKILNRLHKELSITSYDPVKFAIEQKDLKDRLDNELVRHKAKRDIDRIDEELNFIRKKQQEELNFTKKRQDNADFYKFILKCIITIGCFLVIGYLMNVIYFYIKWHSISYICGDKLPEVVDTICNTIKDKYKNNA